MAKKVKSVEEAYLEDQVQTGAMSEKIPALSLAEAQENDPGVEEGFDHTEDGERPAASAEESEVSELPPPLAENSGIGEEDPVNAGDEDAPEIHFLETLETPSGDSAAPTPADPEATAGEEAEEAYIPPEITPKVPGGQPAEKQKPRESSRSAFDRLDIRALDRNLSPDQRQEWEKIYASYRSKSILTGTVLGVDRNRFAVTDSDGVTEERIVYTPVIIDYRVKVLIPETELWMPGEERSDGVVRSLMGTKIDYVITSIDREGEIAIGSRRLALTKRRRRFGMLRSGNRPGDRVKCTILSVGVRRCLVECGGFDLVLSQQELSYPYIQNLREVYHTGMELEAVIKEFSPGEHRLVISVKEVNPNPMEGAELRHPAGCRRIATISNKYKGGIFCKLDDGLTCLALYSNDQLDTDFLPGDRVGVHIARADMERGLFFGRIVSKL